MIEGGLQVPQLMQDGDFQQQQQWGLQMPALQPMDLPTNNFMGAGIPAFELPQQQFQFFAEPPQDQKFSPMEPTMNLFSQDTAAAQTDMKADEQEACDMAAPLAADTATAEAEVMKTRDAKVTKKSKKGGLFCCGAQP